MKVLNDLLAHPVIKWLVFVAYTAVVAHLSLAPSAGEGLPLWDKAMHVTVYAIYTLLGSQLCSGLRQLLILGLIILAYSAVLEIIQSFVGRHMSAADILANGIGISLAAALANRYLFKPQLARQEDQ